MVKKKSKKEKRAEKKAKIQEKQARQRQRRKRRTRYRFDKTRLLLSIVLVAILVYFGVSIKNIVSLKMEQQELRKQQAELKLEKDRLNKELKSVHDENYIEKQARTQLNMIKPGEILYLTDKSKKENNGKQN